MATLKEALVSIVLVHGGFVEPKLVVGIYCTLILAAFITR